MKTLNEVAENYFNTLNPIAERISTDILAAKEAYEDLWNCLSIKERNQIINETVVHPEAILKYALDGKSGNVNFDFPLVTRQVTGSKYVVDENTGLTWRDEHSAPFSWKTPSQIDLSIITASQNNCDQIDNIYIINNKKENQNVEAPPPSLPSLQSDKNFGLKIDPDNNTWSKVNEINGTKKKGLLSQQSNLVLVGTCSKLSGFCSKLKFLPVKSYSYEVQTVVTNPTSSNDGNFLGKIKATAVQKFQNTFKLVGGKSADKKSASNKETENLVSTKGPITIVRLQKPSPKISKPKSPPPPPPVLKPSSVREDKEQDDSNGKTGKNLISANRQSEKQVSGDTDSEKMTLLGENSMQSFLSGDPDSLDHSKMAHELSDDFNSISTECTPLSGPSVDIIPKSGFDFLDNW